MGLFTGDYKLDTAHAVALGSFDGLHIGHRALLSACKEKAEKYGIKSAVCTFDKNPKKVLTGKVSLLTDNEEKIRRINEAGIDDICMECFDAEYAKMPPEEFFYKVLVEKGRAKCLVCGENYRFGAKGEGDIALLDMLCKKEGVELKVVPFVVDDGKIVSSSMIRELIENGETERAARLMTVPFSLTGEVTHGKGLGREMGLPTINLNFGEDSVIPKYGVYAARVAFDGRCYMGAANVGVRPTVNGKGVNAEVHIIDFDGDLYSKTVRVEFLKFIREEKKFSGIDELKAQIEKDKNQIEKNLKV